MFGEEGYLVYLVFKIVEFYERVGCVIIFGSDERVGSVLVIGVVLLFGGDFSELVVQNIFCVVKVFWVFDVDFVRRRYFLVINWFRSYLFYIDVIQDWWYKNVDLEWRKMCDMVMVFFQKEVEFQEIVCIVGLDVLLDREKVIFIVIRMFCEDYFQQDVFDEVDIYCLLKKQVMMMCVIFNFYEKIMQVVDRGVFVDEIVKFLVREKIGCMKFELDVEKVRVFIDEMNQQFEEFFKKYGV